MRGRGNSSPRVALRVASREQRRRFLGETHNMLLTETRVAVLNNEKCNTQQQRPTTTREWVKFSVSNYQGYRRNLSLICRACSLILFLLIFRAICRSAAVGLVCLWVSLPSSSARCFACSFVVSLGREETLGGSVSRSLFSRTRRLTSTRSRLIWHHLYATHRHKTSQDANTVGSRLIQFTSR